MSESKLEYYLRIIPGDQLKTFKSQLTESRKTRDQVLYEILDLILNHETDGRTIYAKIYPDKPFSEKQIRNLRSELLNRLILHITQNTFNPTIERDLFWLKIMNDMGAIKYAEGAFKKIEKKISSLPLSVDQLRLTGQLGTEILHYELSTKGRNTNFYETLLAQQEDAFVAQTLRSALGYREKNLLTYGTASPPPTQLWKGILTNLENGAWSDVKIIQLYYSAYQLSLYSNPEYLHRFVPELIDHTECLSDNETGNLYTIALNHCVRIWRTGNEDILEDLFHLNEKMLEIKLFLSGDVIPPWHFKVIVKCAIHLGKLKWADAFIVNYGSLLPNQGQDAFLAYCQGLVSFYGSRFKESEKWMHESLARNADPFLALDARTYLLRIYYETKDDIGMESMTNSFRLLLRRYKALPPIRLKAYADFVRLYRRLISLEPGNKTQKLALQKEVLTFPNISARKWFQLKLEQ